MKILIAPDSFKESLTALEVANNIEKGILRVCPNCEILKEPMADGGEGTVETLVKSTEGQIIKRKVSGPLGEEVEACFGLLGNGNTAIIEMAEASGINLISEKERNPLNTTTYGTGELISYALDYNIKKLIIGIGGSATNDAGVGMAQALGVKFLDKNNNNISFGGKELNKIETIDMTNLDPRLKNIEIEVACDVNNPLYGPNGAAFVYGTQKGANQKTIELLDKKLEYFNKKIKNIFDIDLQSIPGSGAAGGLGAGLFVFLNAQLKPGVEIILNAVNLNSKLDGVDLVITGEGKLDSQSIHGKTPIGVARISKKKTIPVIAIAGTLGDGVEEVLNHGIDSYFSIINKPATFEQIKKQTPELIKNLSEQIMKTLSLY